jgi:hypothetical protein
MNKLYVLLFLIVGIFAQLDANGTGAQIVNGQEEPKKPSTLPNGKPYGNLMKRNPEWSSSDCSSKGSSAGAQAPVASINESGQVNGDSRAGQGDTSTMNSSEPDVALPDVTLKGGPPHLEEGAFDTVTSWSDLQNGLGEDAEPLTGSRPKVFDNQTLTAEDLAYLKATGSLEQVESTKNWKLLGMGKGAWAALVATGCAGSYILYKKFITSAKKLVTPVDEAAEEAHQELLKQQLLSASAVIKKA